MLTEFFDRVVFGLKPKSYVVQRCGIVIKGIRISTYEAIKGG
jgi:hypothetical protein